MKNKVTLREFIIYLIILTVMFFNLVSATYKMTPIQYKFEFVLFSTTLPMCYLYIIKRYKYAWISLIAFFLIPRPFYIIKCLYSIAKDFNGFIVSMIENQALQTEYYNYFNILVYITIIILALIFSYLIVYKRVIIVFLIFGAAIFSTYYFLGSDQIYTNCSIFLFAGLLLYAFNGYINARHIWKTNNHEVRKNQYKRLVIIISLFLIILNLIVKLMPYAKEPVSFQWFEEKFVSRFENINGRTDRINSYQKNSYNLSYTGYQPKEKRLGGEVVLNHGKALKLYSEDFIGELHLRGSIKDYYNGEVWQKSDKSPTRSGGLINADQVNLPYRINTIKIIPENLKTTTIFNALYPFSIDQKLQNIYLDSDLEVYALKPIKKGQTYEVAFKEYQIDRNTLYNSKRFEDYGSNIVKYLLTPEELPERVKDLTRRVISDYSTPYEKASAIERYLKDNYTYELKTSNLPEGADFVDYFLFVEKKGSCTYYASAMAVMCRLADIPSRYVEGFAVRVNKTKTNIDVLNSNAHAWVELYFDGMGWITFDPTPGHQSASIDISSSEDNEESSSLDEEENITPEQKNENQQNTPRNMEDTDDPNISDEASDSIGAVHIAIAALILCLIVLVIILLVYWLYNKKLVMDKRLINQLLYRLFLYGKALDVTYEEGETLREYFKRLNYQIGINFEDLIGVYENSLYGSGIVEDKEYKIIINKLNSVKNKVILKRGKVSFYLLDLFICLSILSKSIINSRKN